MTVAELIQLLQRHPQDMRVVIDGYEEGYDDLTPEQLQMVKISLNTGTREYVGTHGDADYLPKEKLAGLEVEKALALHRSSH